MSRNRTTSWRGSPTPRPRRPPSRLVLVTVLAVVLVLALTSCSTGERWPDGGSLDPVEVDPVEVDERSQPPAPADAGETEPGALRELFPELEGAPGVIDRMTTGCAPWLFLYAAASELGHAHDPVAVADLREVRRRLGPLLPAELAVDLEQVEAAVRRHVEEVAASPPPSSVDGLAALAEDVRARLATMSDEVDRVEEWSAGRCRPT